MKLALTLKSGILSGLKSLWCGFTSSVVRRFAALQMNSHIQGPMMASSISSSSHILHRKHHKKENKKRGKSQGQSSLCSLSLILFITVIPTLSLSASLPNEDCHCNCEEPSFLAKNNNCKNDNCTSNICWTDQCVSASGYLATAINFEIDPCEDFYKFACGHWVDEHPIPQNLHGWNQFQKISYEIRKNLNGHLNTKKSKFNSTALEKLYDFYHGCVNTNRVGYDYLYTIIDELSGWPMLDGKDWNQESTYRWEKAYIRLTRLNLYFFISIEPVIDFRNTSKMVIKLGPPYKTQENIINLGAQKPEWTFSGLHLSSPTPAITGVPLATTSDADPDASARDLYRRIAKEMKKHQPNSVNLSLDSKLLDEEINEIFQLQHELETRASPIESMDYYKDHYEEHLMTIKRIKQLVDFDLIYIVEKIFNKTVDDDEVVFVPDIDYLRQLGPLIKSTKKRTLANYFTANTVFSLGKYTTSAMVEMLVAKFDAPEVLSNICFEQTAENLPELLSKLYVDNYFDVSIRDNVHSIAKLLQESFHQLLSESQWMDVNTTKEALDKLDTMSVNVAYPDWYLNETQFEKHCSIFEDIDIHDYLRSVVNVNQARQQMQMRELAHRSSSAVGLGWPGKNIIDVNAFYYFTTNGVYLPAGILQQPIYMKNLPSSITFGSIGMIIGHEMTHAFDDSGRAYDKNGALRNWWTNRTRDLFYEKADCFIQQYNSYEFKSININGTQTLAENIADNGGLREAYRAFKIYQSKNESEQDRHLPGTMSRFTPDQLFFISFANMWCANVDQQEIIDDVLNNPHSPLSIRVRGSLANFDQFTAAFGCPVGSKMNPNDKCILW